ncbi:MAG TPA: glutamate--tRNA ligase [Burkholderiales bacterium]|nr:glutamate--tRNA ligase [Burkholderiales bacterium]
MRIEDTDRERSTRESIQAILDGMSWLKLNWDEGPFYQMQRLPRYQEVAQQLLKEDKAYYCYASREELEVMRKAQRARGEKPRYDGRWRDSKQMPPAGVTPVVRFKNPLDGEVEFDDLVKGRIVVQNSELDDVVILRADGVPTYNFGVVVDDLDMGITHVIRGDDHVNNTPRQINILKALGTPLPRYAHVPMILGTDGERFSKRHGAVSVMQYKEEGYLPEALINYLARLGWSHGDAEMFSIEQFVSWFDLKHISKSPAQFNPEKLLWLNHQYIKSGQDAMLAEQIVPDIKRRGGNIAAGPKVVEVVRLLKDRANTLNELAGVAMLFYRYIPPSKELIVEHVNGEVIPALREVAERFGTIDWQRLAINEAIKSVVVKHGLKLPLLAMPLRVLVAGSAQTPPIDATLELIGRERALKRLREQLADHAQ